MDTNQINRSLSKRQTKQESFKAESRQVTLINALWDRMTQLFSHKWVKAQGLKLDESGNLSKNFMLWARKTEGLSDEDWRRGFDRIEFQVKEAGRLGETPWPPSYAEFLGMCEKPVCSKMYKPFVMALPPSDEDQKKRDRAGAQTLSSLKGIFNV